MVDVVITAKGMRQNLMVLPMYVGDKEYSGTLFHTSGTYFGGTLIVPYTTQFMNHPSKHSVCYITYYTIHVTVNIPNTFFVLNS